MKSPILMILSAICVLPAAAQDNRWVTFKTVRDNWGRTEHQIDRTTIRQEGPYRVFWTRIWLPASKQPLAISSSQQLYVISQKFAVDCARHRFVTRFIDSTDPRERSKTVNLQTVTWEGLDKHPIVDKTVCGNRK